MNTIKSKRNASGWLTISTLTLTLISTLTLFPSCEKPDRNNPWDDEATFDQQQYAPKNLAVEANSATQVTLSWDYDEIEPGGFAIARRENDGSWTVDFAITQQKTFTDTNVNLLSNSYEYRVHSYYSANTSSATEIKIAPPSVTTQPVTEILAQSAKSGGVVTEFSLPVDSRGVVWGTISNPELPESKDLETKSYVGHTTDGSGAGSYESILAGLIPQVTYYLRAYTTTTLGVLYGNEVTFATPELTTPSVTTNIITNITENSAIGGGNVTSSGGATVTARGIAYGTSQNPTIADNNVSAGNGTGLFTANMTGLQSSTTYYVCAYATNSVGTTYGEQVQFETTNWFNDVTNPATGKTWMDRNLGATRAATSSTDAQAYGDLYQWGRDTDGHEKRTSGTTSTLSSNDTPGHGFFITVNGGNYDWRSPQNNNLWQGVNGTNNPCPAGYRLPTEAEWNAERLSWSSNNAAGAFASPLKLPLVAGYRSYDNGTIYTMGSIGYCWSSTTDGTSARLLIYGSSAYMGSYHRAYGYSVRCIKD